VILEGADASAAASAAENIKKEIDIDTFRSVPISVKDWVVNVSGAPLVLGGEPLRTKKIKDGEVH
jgi:hypothetical protein